jgi:hypothetical protein
MADNPLGAVFNMVNAITEQYPAFAPLLQIPEIAKLLIQASTPGAQWSPAKLQAEIQGTNWWKTNSDSAKAWQVTKLVNPATAAQSAAASAAGILSLAGQEGIVLTPEQVASLASQANEHAWTSTQLQQHIGQQANPKTLKAGTIQSTQRTLGGIAQSYGVPLSDQAAFSWAQRIAEGTATQEGFNAYAQDQAKLHFPTLAKHIDQGMTVRQLADPYLQIAGQTLGVDPNSLDISSPRWAAALQHRDKEGNIVGPLTTLDWTRKIMEDPVYGYDHTSNAQAAATSLVQQLGDAFGVSK